MIKISILCLKVILIFIVFSKNSYATSQEIANKNDSIKVVKLDSITSYRNQLPSPFAMITNLPNDWFEFGKYLVTNKGIISIFEHSIYAWILVDTDYESWQLFKKPYEKYPAFKFACDVGEGIGDGKTQFGIAAALAVYGFAFNDSIAKRCASQITEVIFSCGTIIQILKHTTGRESPFVATTPTGRWRLFPNQKDYFYNVPNYDAFPSGHVATATATYFVIQNNYPDQKWLPYVGYPIISLVAIGLVGTSIHWWSDIPLGVAIGYYFANLVSPKTEVEKLTTSNYKINYGFNFLSDGSLSFGLNVKF